MRYFFTRSHFFLYSWNSKMYSIEFQVSYLYAVSFFFFYEQPLSRKAVHRQNNTFYLTGCYGCHLEYFMMKNFYVYFYIWGIPRQFDQDLAVMSHIFSVIFYMKLPVEKYIPNFFKIFLLFVFQISFFSKQNHHFLRSEKSHINLIKYINIFEPY